jgi:hypothetical protein
VQREPFRWLHSRRPAAILAGSLLVFDLTGDADAFLEVAGIFRWMGKEAAARGAEAMAAAVGSRSGRSHGTGVSYKSSPLTHVRAKNPLIAG